VETFRCSLDVYGLLQGLLERSAFGGDILARRVPTYFGMVVALFHANEKGWKVLPRPFNGKGGGGAIAGIGGGLGGYPGLPSIP